MKEVRVVLDEVANMKELKFIVLGGVLALCLLVVGAVAADPTIEINGKIPAKITIDVSPNTLWDFGSIEPQDPAEAQTRSETITIKSNKGWTLTAKDILAGYSPAKTDKGYMVQWTGSAWLSSKLTDTLKITGTGGPWDLASDPQLATGAKGITSPALSRTLSQTIQYTDDPTTDPNKYRVVVTFVAAQI